MGFKGFRTSRPSQRPLFVLNLNSTSYGGFKYIDVYVFCGFELDAIPTHACLPQLFSKRPGQVRLVVKTDDIYRDPGGIRTQANLIELFGLAVGVFYDLR